MGSVDFISELLGLLRHSYCHSNEKTQLKFYFDKSITSSLGAGGKVSLPQIYYSLHLYKPLQIRQTIGIIGLRVLYVKRLLKFSFIDNNNLFF